MKASLKLRSSEQKPPLFRLKLPITALGLPLISSVAASSAAGDLSLGLRSALPKAPSLHLHLRPHRPSAPLALQLRSHPLALPPLTVSASLSAAGAATLAGFPSDLSFTLSVAIRIGDFAFKKTARQPLNPNPNPSHQNGAGVYHPLPVRPPAPPPDRLVLEDLISASDLSLSAYTSVPVTSRSALKIRWGFDFPGEMPSLERREIVPPQFRVNKISFEAVEAANRGKLERGQDRNLNLNLGGSELEAMSELKLWVSELERENRMIRESLQQVWRNVADRRGGRGRLDSGLENANVSDGGRGEDRSKKGFRGYR